MQGNVRRTLAALALAALASRCLAERGVHLPNPREFVLRCAKAHAAEMRLVEGARSARPVVRTRDA